MEQPGLENDMPTHAMAVFALGRADASLAFLRLLPEDVRDKVTSILALRLLAKLWAQYRIDSGIIYGRTLLSVDNGYEHRIFTTLIDEFADWAPLRRANALIRSHSPALSLHEQQAYDREIDLRRELLSDVRDLVKRLPATQEPVCRAGLLSDWSQRFEALDEYGVCWALNLASALELNILGATHAAPPFPSLFSREMLRFDRSVKWRNSALCAALTESAHILSQAVFGSVAGVSAFDGAFAQLRSHSRLSVAFIYMAGIGEMTPALLARLVQCSEPGARKMLRQLVGGGFLTHHIQSVSYLLIENFRLARSGAPWLRSIPMADDLSNADTFDS
jgi:hypothetical protein